MSVTYFGSAANPTDNGTNTTVPAAVAPPASMLEGDLVYFVGMTRDSTGVTITISNTGGQNWVAQTAWSNTSITARLFVARFNGTWAANPSITVAGGTSPYSAAMHVFRPTGTTYGWDYQVGGASNHTGGTGIALPSNAFSGNSVVIAAIFSTAANTWGNIVNVTGTGWAALGSAQYRNVSGSGLSAAFAYKINNSAGDDATIDQLTLGPTAGVKNVSAFAEVAPLTADQGAYTLTGQAVNLLRAQVPLTAIQGAYALTGQPLNLLVGRRLVVVQGAYSLSGQAVTLLRARVPITAVQGAYTLTGSATSFRRARVPLTAVQGAYTLTGQVVNLLRGLRLALTQGAYALTGQVVNLLRGLRLTAAQGAYSLSGQAVTLTYTPGTAGYTLAIGQGSYALSGQAVALLAAHMLSAGQGSYALSGQDAAFLRTLILGTATGSYVLTGQAAELLAAAVEILSTTLPVIIAAITALLEDLTPGDQSDTGFRRGPRRVDLRRQPATSALLRRFQLMRAGAREEPGHATDTVYVARKVRLEVAYPAALVGLYGDEDLDDLADIMDADARQIADALSSPANVANGGHKANFVTIEKPDRTAAVWFQPFTIDVRYFTPESSS